MRCKGNVGSILVEAGRLSVREEDQAEAEHRVIEGAVFNSADVVLGLAGPLSWRTVSMGSVDVPVCSWIL